MNNNSIENAKEHFANLIKKQLDRIETMKMGKDWIEYNSLKPIIIGIIAGDGIGRFALLKQLFMALSQLVFQLLL